MKKTLAGLFAAALMIAGFETFAVSTPAQASLPSASSATVAARATPCYPASIGTKTKVVAPPRVKKGNRVIVTARVTPNSGSAKPLGSLRARVRLDGKIYRQVSRGYAGGTTNFIFPGPAFIGQYVINIRYLPRKCSVYKTSLGTDTFRVTRN